MCLIGTLSILSTAANAVDLATPPAKRTVNDTKIDVDAYSIQGTELSIQNDRVTTAEIAICQTDGVVCSGLRPNVQTADINCTGGGPDGGWNGSVQGSASEKLCWSELTITYNGGTPFIIRQGDADTERFIPTAKLEIDRNASIGGAPGATNFSKCATTAMSTDGNYKEYCVWDATDGITALEERIAGSRTGTTDTITGATGDDMLRLTRDKAAYFEYIDVGEGDPDNLKYIYRNTSGATTSDMMVPAGPKDTYDDFRNFVNNPPSDVITLNACYPMSAEIKCSGGDELLPPIDGVCGTATLAAAATYDTSSEILPAAFCGPGQKAVDINDDGALGITWTCEGLYGGAPSPQCIHYKQINGQCSSETHLQRFSTLEELNAEGEFCAPGSSKVSGPNGSGPWTWECAPDRRVTGATNAQCIAFERGQDCSEFFDNRNMVISQDLSGSFSDDLGNTKSALTVLFNDPLFADWEVGITSYKDFGDNYSYRNNLNLTNTTEDKTTITNTYNSFSASGGGDYPESQVFALAEAVDEFTPQAPGQRITYVLITDATSHTGGRYGTFANLAAKMDANNAALIVLGTGNVKSYYEDIITSNGYKGSFSTITSNSSNLAGALLAGLVDLGCRPLPDPIAETCEYDASNIDFPIDLTTGERVGAPCLTFCPAGQEVVSMNCTLGTAGTSLGEQGDHAEGIAYPTSDVGGVEDDVQGMYCSFGSTIEPTTISIGSELQCQETILEE